MGPDTTQVPNALDNLHFVLLLLVVVGLLIINEPNNWDTVDFTTDVLRSLSIRV